MAANIRIYGPPEGVDVRVIRPPQIKEEQNGH
jgi:hypothetical protein